MSETLDQEYYDNLIFLRIDDLVFNTQFFGQKADAMVDELAEEHGTNVSDMQKFGICERIRSFEEEYVESCEDRFLADVQAKKFKTEDEWIDYQDDLIISTVAYAKAKAETLDWSVVESEDDGEILTSEDKIQIVESFNDYTSWIDSEEAGEIYEVSAEVTEQHQISSSANLGYLFLSKGPFVTQAANALNDLRNKYGQRMQQAFRDGVVKTDSEYEFPDADVNKLRQKLIELYPDCSAYDATGDEAVSKLQGNMEE